MKSVLYLIMMTMVLLVAGCGHEHDNVVLSSMVGKNIRDNEIQRWLSKVGKSPEINKFDDRYFYSFKSKGISLCFDTTDTVIGVFLYSEGADGYRQYQGDLPFGLSFAQTRKEVESILGHPEYDGGGGIINYRVIYKRKGIGITYNNKRSDDLYARIYTISIQ